MIGFFMYLTDSHPDISFVSWYSARYQANPKETHEKDIKQIFRYLKGIPKLDL